MIAALKLLIGATYGLIAYQDFRFRAVSWVLFPSLGILLLLLQGKILGYQLAFLGSLFNVLLVLLIVLLLFMYTRFIRQKRFLNTAFGLGDLLFFCAFALGYPSATFVVLFCGSVFFALVFHLVQIEKPENRTIPLAGLMSLYLLLILIAESFLASPQLYLI